MPDFSDWALDTEFRLDTDSVLGGDQGSGIRDPQSPIPDPYGDPVLDELEEWLAAIVADRSQSQ